MLKIFEIVWTIFIKGKKHESEEYLQGFKDCLTFFYIAIKQSDQFNYALTNRDLESNLKHKLEKIRQLEAKIKNLEKLAQSKSIVNNTPLENYINYSVASTFGEFFVITNMDKDTFLACLMNFTLRYGYNSKDEAKSKLLSYINSKEFIGFRAFKDLKSYNIFAGSQSKSPYKKRG